MSKSEKPLPLKQRTTSLDQRRDYTAQTWLSLTGLLKAREFFITVDHFSIWRRHLAWAVEDGKDLREYMTQRYASSMIFLSLLLSTELNVLFNSAGITTTIRAALAHEQYTTVAFWAGFCIIISAICSLLSLISTFTAWAMVSAISATNTHCVFRSSIGQYVAELPGRFIVGAIYSFLAWICLFFFLLMPLGFWSIILLIFTLSLMVHTITVFSAFGRIIMHTGAMADTPIFDKSFESNLLPHTLHKMLLTKAQANLRNKTSIRRQYKVTKTLSRVYMSPEELSAHLSDRSPVRKRTGSLVTFADETTPPAKNNNQLPPRAESLIDNFEERWMSSSSNGELETSSNSILREAAAAPLNHVRPPYGNSSSLELSDDDEEGLFGLEDLLESEEYSARETDGLLVATRNGYDALDANSRGKER